MSESLKKANPKRHLFYILFFFLLFSGTLNSNAAKTPYSENHLPQNNNFLLIHSDTRQRLPMICTDPLSMYFSSNSQVVSVSRTGILTAHNTGAAQILYTHLGHIYCCNIQVPESDSAVTVTPQTQKEIAFSLGDSLLFMEPGDAYKVEISIPSGIRSNHYNDFSWSSNDIGVARVDALGQITACGKGSATITCRLGNQTSKVHVNVITDDYAGKACDFSILTASGDTRTYRFFKQNAHNYLKYDNYIAWHGCATCSLASVLGAYNTQYSGILPNEVIDGPEKSTVDNSSWQKHHVERSLPKQMPLSLYGISSILTKHDISNDYVRTYQEEEVREDILSHLKTGNPIIFEVGQKNNHTGKKNQRWTNSYHTMVFLGALTNGKVLLYDAIDRSWYKGGDRVKIVELDDLLRFMFPCTEFSESMYFDGAKSDGGYIKVYDSK